MKTPHRTNALFGRAAALLLPAVSFLPAPCEAQTYPARPVRIVVPLSTGSTSDATARTIAAKLSDLWGQQAVVENVPGANGITGATLVTKAPPDGYTLAVFASNHVINAGLYSKLPFDPVRDFAAIAQVGWTPLMLVVHPSLPTRTVQEFVQLAKSRPGQLNFGSPGSGSPAHLCMELLKTLSGTNLAHIPYKAVSQAQSDLIAGQIPTMFMVPVVAAPQHKAGRLRAIAASSSVRSGAMPDIPTLEEAGLKGYDIRAWISFFGPPGLSSELTTRIATDVQRVGAMPDVQERIRVLGLEAEYKSPAELRSYLPRDKDKWSELVRRSGARVD